MHSEPMIAVRDVQKSAEWYCRLLDGESDHGLEEFDRIVRDLPSVMSVEVQTLP